MASVCLPAATTFAGNGANWSFAPKAWPGPIAYVTKSRSVFALLDVVGKMT